MAEKHGRGKVFAWTGLALTLGLLGALVLVYHQAFLEAWHLRRLERGSDEEKLAALAKLTELRSRKAVSRVIGWILGGGEMSKAARKAVLELGEDAIPALLGVVRNGRESEECRFNAAVMVVKVRGEAPETLLLLVDAFDEGTARVLQGPVEHLLQKCRDLKGAALLAAISRKPGPERSQLLQLCAGAGRWSDGARSAILGLLAEDPDGELRLQAALALLDFEEIPGEASAILVRALGDPEASVRQTAASALALRPGPQAREAVPALEKLLGDPEEVVRAAAASALARISPRVLIQAAAHADEAVRLAAVGGFGEQHGEEGVRTVVRLLREEPSEEVRLAALGALDSLGVHAGQAIPVLLDLLERESDSLRPQLVQALGRLGKRRADEVVPAMVKLIRGGEPALRPMAVFALLDLGPEASAETIPLLIEGLADPELAAACAATLGGFGKPAVAHLRKALAREPESARRVAALALGRIGREAREALPELGGLLQDADGGVRLAALEALAQIQPPGPEAAAVLARALLDREPQVRLQAALWLGEMGAEAAAAVPGLEQALRDPEPEVREAAASALEGIRARERESRK